MSIPKVIHHIWIGPKKCPMSLIRTWKNKHRSEDGWTHKLWTEIDLVDFNMQNRKHFDEIEEWAGKADLWRYEILHRHGGVYCDADSECTNTLDDHFFQQDSFACYENEEVRKGLVANCYIGATKHNALMKYMIDELYKTPNVTQEATKLRAWQTTGPELLTRVIRNYAYPITIYPSHTFIPEHYSGVKYEGNEKTYSKHYFGSTLEFSNPGFYGELAR